MYCINCGVKLADTEKICPLCNTSVYHPELSREKAVPLYPEGTKPKTKIGSKALNGMVLIMFFIPVLVCFLCDFQINGKLEWSGLAAGGLFLGYIIIALPGWFKKPNPVIFVPCDFAAIGLYLLYINIVTGGKWFLSFALPVLAGFCIITCAVVTLLYYLKRGRLYIFGGAFIVTGAMMLLIEFLLKITFGISFVGWSFYPLITLFLVGCALIFLAINASAREMMERKLFF